MASITRKIIHGQTYYYARQSARVDGRPKIVKTWYLGRVDDIIAKCTDPTVAPAPRTLVRDFGAVAALFDLAQRLRLVEHVDRHVPQRGSGPSVGTYLLVAILNRCLAPCSEAGIAAWYDRTVLPELLPVRGSQLSSQHFWDNFDRVTPDAIQAIECDLVAALVRDFEIDLRQVLFDTTNCFTFLDTSNNKSSLAERGHTKEGPTSLRSVGVALLASRDFHVPLFHHTYTDNQPDAPQLRSLCSQIATRCQAISAACESITLVFDENETSEANLALVDASEFHVIGSLAPALYPDLLATPPAELADLTAAGLPGVRAQRVRRNIYGVERTVVVTYNDELFQAQTRSLARLIGQRRRKLEALAAQLDSWQAGEVKSGRAPTVAGVTKKVNGWLRARHLSDLFRVTIGERDGLPTLEHAFDAEAWERLQSTLLGKTLLFTDNDDWSDAEIVRGYLAQRRVERAFRTMQCRHRMALRPPSHWTDQRIEVHVFCCMLALLLSSLLQRELQRQGVERTPDELFDQLGGIREVELLYPPRDKRGKTRSTRIVSEMTPEQRTLYEALKLDRHMPA